MKKIFLAICLLASFCSYGQVLIGKTVPEILKFYNDVGTPHKIDVGIRGECDTMLVVETKTYIMFAEIDTQYHKCYEHTMMIKEETVPMMEEMLDNHLERIAQKYWVTPDNRMYVERDSATKLLWNNSVYTGVIYVTGLTPYGKLTRP